MSNVYNLVSNRYPYSVVPQYTDPAGAGLPQKTLRCQTNPNAKFIIFNENNLSVIQGSDWKSNFELKDFFVPIDNYLETEFVLNSHTYPYYSTFNVSIGTDMSASFVCIIPQYIDMSGDDQNLWSLNWRYSGEENWRKLGRILMYDVGLGNTHGTFEIQNLMGDSVKLKILLGK